MRAVVIVLGDLGRSPRMQYHARALAVNGIDVDLVGEDGAALPAFLDDARIRVHRLPARRPSAASPLRFVVRAVSASLQSARELYTLLRNLPRPDLILVQTPPAIPSLAIAWLAARRHGARLVFDWHNLGWTILALRFGAGHPAVRLARALERRSAHLADAHLAVSTALATDLEQQWGLSPVHVVRDRAAETFSPLTANHSLRARFVGEAGFDANARPAFVISPTSWTRDEDMDLLIEAADALEVRWASRPAPVQLLILVSGQGAGRAAFEARIAARRRGRVRLLTAWVPPDDYPSLVASADAGICVHRSSSGLDLPMKVADMLGAGVPPCMLDYGPAVLEAVQPDRNALLFRDARELAARLDELFGEWPARSATWERVRAGAVEAAAAPRWTRGWEADAKPVLVRP